ncbi:MAG: HesA/MoeB/ThiF family protein [Candidatus Asgardarchaeia archaeon]
MSNRLSSSELERYSRQIMILGEDGQLKLKKSTVAIVGVGGLGSPIALYLTAAGIGHIILVDSQYPELSNLNRQILHWEPDLKKKPKVESAKEKLQKLNSTVKVTTYNVKLDENNISQILGDADVIVDALDNYETRYLINKYCVDTKKPLVHAAVEGMFGQITTIIPGETPCLKCIIPTAPTSVEPFPILGTTAGLLGLLEANEVIKLIVGTGDLLKGKLLLVDLERNDFVTVPVQRNLNCPVCSKLFKNV